MAWTFVFHFEQSEIVRWESDNEYSFVEIQYGQFLYGASVHPIDFVYNRCSLIHLDSRQTRFNVTTPFRIMNIKNKMKTRAIHSLMLLCPGLVRGALDGSRYMWYTQPGRYPIFEDGLPIGNGRVGAAIYGGASEVIGINENSIWTGPFQDRIADDPQAAEKVVREMLVAGNLSHAHNYTMQAMIPSNNSPRSFSYFGNIEIDFGHASDDMTDYIRWLDTEEGTTGVSYAYQGANYRSVIEQQQVQSDDHLKNMPVASMLRVFLTGCW